MRVRLITEGFANTETVLVVCHSSGLDLEKLAKYKLKEHFWQKDT
jgi:hypothetical protein